MSDELPSAPHPLDRAKLKLAVEDLRRLRTRYGRLCLIEKDILDLISRDNRGSEGRVNLLIGVSRIGKSHLVELVAFRFPVRQKANQSENGDFSDEIPMVSVSARNASLKALAERIYQKFSGRSIEDVLGGRYNRDKIVDQIAHVARICGTKLVAIDEVHELLEGRAREKPESVALFMKDLVNLKIFSLLLVGTDDVTRIIDANVELKKRTPRRHALAPFGRTETDIEDWLDVLDDYDRHLQDDVFGHSSNLTDPVMAEALREASGGVVGDAAELIEAAAIVALDDWIARQDDRGMVPGIRWEHLESAFNSWFMAEGKGNPFSPGDRARVKRAAAMPPVEAAVLEPEGPVSGVRGSSSPRRDASFQK